MTLMTWAHQREYLLAYALDARDSMGLPMLHDAIVEAVRRAETTNALERLASCVKDGVLQMRDVDRAAVYQEHLGKKLAT